MKETKTDLLLVNPPFQSITGPYISIPVLSSYLKAKGLTVSAYDLNGEVYARLLEPKRLRQSIKYGLKRLIELNDRQKLRFYEMYEYWLLYRIFIEAEKNHPYFSWLYYPFDDYMDLNEFPLHARNLVIELATLQYFPQILVSNPRFDIKTNYDNYSSESIIKSANCVNEYTLMYESLLLAPVERQNPRFIGFSVVYNHQVQPAFQCAKIIKRHFPGMYISVGGPFISVHMRTVDNKEIFSIVDSLILDEGEIPLERLSSALKEESPRFDTVPGMVYLNDGEIRANAPAPSPAMECQPPPDYLVFDLDSYPIKRENLRVPFRLSKGCSWRKCSFCRTDLWFAKNFQQPKFSTIFDQLKHAVLEKGLRNFMFSDESADPELLEYISERILQENIKINWFCHTRVSRKLTKDRCRLFKEAGCFIMGMGLESFNNRILRLMQKGITYELIEQVLIEIDGVLPIMSYLIVGFPTEEEEEALEGFKQFEQFREEGLIQLCHYNIFMILYGSEIYNNPEKFGIREMYHPPGQDLCPDIYDFKGKGMSRKRAYQLMIEFNDIFKSVFDRDNSDALDFYSSKISMNFNFERINSLIRDRWDHSYLPHRQWIEKWEKNFTLERG